MQPSGTQLRQISALVEAGKIVPIIDRTFALADAQQALEYMESGRAKGKVVIKVR